MPVLDGPSFASVGDVIDALRAPQVIAAVIAGIVTLVSGVVAALVRRLGAERRLRRVQLVKAELETLEVLVRLNSPTQALPMERIGGRVAALWEDLQPTGGERQRRTGRLSVALQSAGNTAVGGWLIAFGQWCRALAILLGALMLGCYFGMGVFLLGTGVFVMVTSQAELASSLGLVAGGVALSLVFGSVLRYWIGWSRVVDNLARVAIGIIDLLRPRAMRRAVGAVADRSQS